MSQRRPSAVVVTAVLFGAFLLFVPLTYEATVRTVLVFAGWLGVRHPLSGLAGRVVRIGSIAAGFKVAADVATIRLAGYGALTRGPLAARATSLLLLSWTAFAGAVLVADFGYMYLVRGLATGRSGLLGVGALLFVALLWVAVRSTRAFLRGYRGGGSQNERTSG